MDESRFLSLPVELQECIVVRVSKGSVEDLLNLKQTCKELDELSEQPVIYASINLLGFTWNQFFRGELFMERCYNHGNPHAIYIKGTQDFFMHGEPIEGLRAIQLVVHKGCEFALYTYVMIRKIFYDDDAPLSQITRESVLRESSRLFFHRVGRIHVLHAMAPTRDSVVECMLPVVYQCKCSPHKSTFSWCRYDVEDHKLCNRCFWLSHIGTFSHCFNVVRLSDTRLWGLSDSE